VKKDSNNKEYLPLARRLHVFWLFFGFGGVGGGLFFGGGGFFLGVLVWGRRVGRRLLLASAEEAKSLAANPCFEGEGNPPADTETS